MAYVREGDTVVVWKLELKRGNRWAMTQQQILAVIESMTVPAREPEHYPEGMTRRSWLYQQRQRAGRSVIRPGPRRVTPSRPRWLRNCGCQSISPLTPLYEILSTSR